MTVMATADRIQTCKRCCTGQLMSPAQVPVPLQDCTSETEALPPATQMRLDSRDCHSLLMSYTAGKHCVQVRMQEGSSDANSAGARQLVGGPTSAVSKWCDWLNCC